MHGSVCAPEIRFLIGPVVAAATRVLHHVEHSTINVGCNARAAALSPVVYGLLQPI